MEDSERYLPELIVEEYFGFRKPLSERTEVKTDYGQLVGLVVLALEKYGQSIPINEVKEYKNPLKECEQDMIDAGFAEDDFKDEVKEDSEKHLYDSGVYTEVIHLVERDYVQCELYLDTLKKLMTRFTITRKVKEEDKPTPLIPDRDLEYFKKLNK